VVVDAAAVIARLLLAVVFAVAGVSKLRDRPGTREATVGFGVPPRLARPLALLLPVVELAVAVLLLPAATAAVGAACALFLLLLFSTAIAANLARGRTPECHCFGQLHSEPAGWKTLGRNAALAGVALFALGGTLAEPPASALAWIGRLDGSELLALAVAVAALALLALGAAAFVTLMRSYGKLLVRLDRLEAAIQSAGIEIPGDEPMPELGLEPGTPAPAFAGLDELLAPGVPVLLLFTSPNCGPCKALLPRAAEWQREDADVLTVAFASDGEADDVRAEADEFELDHVLVDEGHRIYESFRANGTPSAVVVATDGTIASWVASGSEWIERLVAEATAEPAEDERLPLGSPAPDIGLTTLEGDSMTVSELRGRDTLLLFWNPDCSFCRSMHEELRAWEESMNGTAPQLVVVSSGDAESTREEGFRSLVLLDESFEAGSAFGANGTPMAVLVDRDGRVASSVVAGADAVLALATTDAEVA
jgi:thiol-disulfide isomerase/thioredoxin/uncharacterized membrane protein YphA (DoxX/SURF4 family)